MHKVLRKFPCSFDGVTIEDLDIGDVRDFGTLAEGLQNAGYVGAPDDCVVVAAEVERELEPAKKATASRGSKPSGKG